MIEDKATLGIKVVEGNIQFLLVDWISDKDTGLAKSGKVKVMGLRI